MNGEALQRIRVSKKLSRKELAEKAYVTEHYIQSWEEGWYIELPSDGEIEAMAEALMIDEEELRKLLDLDDCDNETDVGLIDYVDALGRMIKQIKKRCQEDSSDNN